MRLQIELSLMALCLLNIAVTNMIVRDKVADD